MFDFSILYFCISSMMDISNEESMANLSIPMAACARRVSPPNTVNRPRISDCCICFSEKPFRVINEPEFREMFEFHCPHASRDICYSCWNEMANRTCIHKQIRCPLCRANKNKSMQRVWYDVDIHHTRLSASRARTVSMDELIRLYNAKLKKQVLALCLFFGIICIFCYTVRPPK